MTKKKGVNAIDLKSENRVLQTEDKEILTVPKAAELLGLSPSTIYTYISKRKIPFVKRNGTVWLLRSRLLEWLREGEFETFNELSK